MFCNSFEIHLSLRLHLRTKKTIIDWRNMSKTAKYQINIEHLFPEQIAGSSSGVVAVKPFLSQHEATHSYQQLVKSCDVSDKIDQT